MSSPGFALFVCSCIRENSALSHQRGCHRPRATPTPWKIKVNANTYVYHCLRRKQKGLLFFLINVAIPLLTVFLKPYGSLGSEGFVC